jgi:hypothetical protein
MFLKGIKAFEERHDGKYKMSLEYLVPESKGN